MDILRLPQLGFPWTEETLTLLRLPRVPGLERKPLENYFGTLNFLRHVASLERDPLARSVSSRVWARARDAKIFEIPSELYAALYTQASMHTCMQIAGKPRLGDKTPADAVRGYAKQLGTMATGMRLPEQRPFSDVFFAYTVPLIVPGNLTAVYHGETESTSPYVPGENDVEFLCGHLITEDEVWAALCSLNLKTQDSRDAAFLVIPQLYEHQWYHPVSLQPWVLPALVDWINEHRTVAVEEVRGRLSHKRMIQREMKKLNVKKLVPPPYYTVHLKNVLVEESAKSSMGTAVRRHIDWQHRWTVRGHSMVRVKRGPLPLDPKTEAQLRKRKYRIFALDKLDAETAALLQVRDFAPKRATEWMAVLVSWRKDFVKGPPDKPLIPSVRKASYP